MKLTEAIALLNEAGIDSARHDARMLFEFVGKVEKSRLLFPDAFCDLPELTDAVKRRANREPLQYILGEVDFYRESYNVNKSCLIPRADTEILVDYAVKHLPDGCRFVDVCTGSGCVAVSTLKNTRDTQAVAIDISEDALAVAKQNAIKNSVSDRVEFVCADALTTAIGGTFFALLSNPPYVTEAAYESLAPEIYYEPKIAFVGGTDGLDFYKRLIELYKDRLDNAGFFAFEIGFDQACALSDLASAYGMRCEIIKDYSSNDRVAVLRKQIL